MLVLAKHVCRLTVLTTVFRLMMQGEEGRVYEDLGSYDLMKPVVEELLAEYNSKKKPMNLVFFDDAIEHLTRIHRILRLQQVSFPAISTCTIRIVNERLPSGVVGLESC